MKNILRRADTDIMFRTRDETDKVPKDSDEETVCKERYPICIRIFINTIENKTIMRQQLY